MLQDWWNASTNPGSLALEIASSSDRVNLPKHTPDPKQPLEVRHPISGASQPGLPQPAPLLAHADIETAIDQIRSAVDNSRIPDAEKQQERDRRLFWWFWRFYPELLAQEQSPQTLLHPAHPILPDCPWHSYASTTSALVGAMISDSDSPETPYLLHFTFSPVQEFIKASRKFLDFWAGSYLLHYLSVKLCWYAAQKYGADAIITPSLWSQEIIDALMVQEFDQDGSTLFKTTLQKIQGSDPVKRFNDRDSTSLSTAGFPNAITILVPGKKAAETLGKELTHKLIEEWLTIAIGPPNEHQRRQGGICDHIRDQVIKTLNTLDQSQLLKELGIPEGDRAPYYKDLHQWKTQSNWQWRRLWEAQISHTWEPYWTAIPIASPGSPLSISLTEFGYDNWERNQNELAQDSLLSEQEKTIYRSLDQHSQPDCSVSTDRSTSINVGTWWGSIQQRLRVYTQSIKNNRTWQIPVAPGTRSTLSGQFSAVHPALNYTVVQRYGEERDLREGSGLPLGSMRLFWLVLSKAYPGLFNGSEQLNALELTKRMAWVYGGVAESLGIQVSKVIRRIETRRNPQSTPQSAQLERLLYEQFIRFPNLSSVASARFIHDHPQKVQAYWQLLNQSSTPFNSKLFQRVTRIRPSHILKTDNKVNPAKSKRQYYNGAMFSAKWLAEDLNLDQPKTQELRRCVESAHKASGFGDGSPSDW